MPGMSQPENTTDPPEKIKELERRIRELEKRVAALEQCTGETIVFEGAHGFSVNPVDVMVSY
jgi:hypothetical protein